MSRPNAQSMKPATAAKKLDVYLPATPAEFQAGPITRSELAALQADPPQWLRDLRKNGPHPKNLVAAADEITAADLDGEPILLPLDDVLAWAGAPGAPVDYRPETTKDAIELVAAGMGVLIVPQSLARLYHRKDLTYRPITDAPACPVALAFRHGSQSVLIEEFIGIVRGRRPGSSRGQAQPVPKRTAREKTLAKQAARAAAGKVARKPGPGRRGRR
ncbi:DUF5997 family protein [Mycolicibacter sinensis]|uniref:DUF5997 family protein n=1 Tax=Mycolicibacter sinensis (strain JDM601) TaxID=875328 RepID=UPI0031838009